jgi:hypothetical protein
MIQPTRVTLLKTVTLVIGGPGHLSRGVGLPPDRLAVDPCARGWVRRLHRRCCHRRPVRFLVPVGVETALVAGSAFTAVGFGAILYSLYRG